MIFDISKEDFIEIMKIESFQLPKRWDGRDYYVSVSNLFNEYLEYLSRYLKRSEVKRVETICKRVKSAIYEYHNGLPSNALNELTHAMDLLMKNPLKIYPKNDGPHSKFSIDDPLQLYRVRNVQEKRIYFRKDIFHTPYLLRSKIRACRYSISGYPSLYLATSLELCCEEIKINSFNDMTIASRYQIRRDIKPNELRISVIEMGIKPNHFVNYYNRRFKQNTEYCLINYTENNFVDKYLSEIDLFDESKISNYLYWYPIIAASSFIRVNRNDAFASEYIIPQLLMQWIRKRQTSERELFGIRYFSCASKRASDIGLNYVFPARGIEQDYNGSFCNTLSKSFILTVPYYINEFDSLKDCEDKLRLDTSLDSI